MVEEVAETEEVVGAAEAVGASKQHVAWKVAAIVFGIGLAVWLIQLIVVLFLVDADATRYPGTVARMGGEWRGWFGPGWSVQSNWTLCTIETCTDFASTTRFILSPFVAVWAIGWGAISVGIGWLVEMLRRLAQS